MRFFYWGFFLEEKEENNEKISNKSDSLNDVKNNNLRVGNNPFGNPFGKNNNDSDNTSEGSNLKQNKRVLQNRYVANYK